MRVLWGQWIAAGHSAVLYVLGMRALEASSDQSVAVHFISGFCLAGFERGGDHSRGYGFCLSGELACGGLLEVFGYLFAGSLSEVSSMGRRGRACGFLP